ncbi:hypothetical protein A2774_00535 [Candidatus Roizmanbacteria bacterium RIFCSPHIGHO2_01_FULL_39_12c]|uniref:Sulfotransferase domain-containing protein n=1 Tax=Candidatus Roizmanbacteria bacterium RIFCSPHIGHO2_01_FULL_39_12c TaxID=1802031 RepID=A0A1F7GA16_9BACT|nr:MAG: hypothetical protein A2774_00535 [Candidatus Roizmanbacteria bacterium RIFCSPHIGHO2_01_FULL_39_12c]OGK46211.1 MAG: hypothetical protein A2963_01965 [Candidatus Roizmanbacteria bacterium RIFCSPLOWO2_01_FULL_40_13]
MAVERGIITSVHIPKTGGVSLKKFWVDLFGAENVFFSYPNKGGLYRASEEGLFRQPNPFMYQLKRRLIETNLGRFLYQSIYKATRPNIAILHDEIVPPECKVVHGHFTPDHFAKTIKDARLVTVLREPLDRAKSHYKYLRDHVRIMAIKKEFFRPNMSFEEFAELPYQTNYQYRHLHGVSLNKFDVVGTMKALDCYCKNFDPEGNVSLSKLNTTAGDVSVSEQFKNRFQQLNSLDYQIYNEALLRTS